MSLSRAAERCLHLFCIHFSSGGDDGAVGKGVVGLLWVPLSLFDISVVLDDMLCFIERQYLKAEMATVASKVASQMPTAVYCTDSPLKSLNLEATKIKKCFFSF